jgi:uncharacterized membrane protein
MVRVAPTSGCRNARFHGLTELCSRSKPDEQEIALPIPEILVLVFFCVAPKTNRASTAIARTRRVAAGRIASVRSETLHQFSPLVRAARLNDRTPMKLLVLTHVFATVFMVGLIWFIQVVHYPLFANVGQAHFKVYEELHQRLTRCVVAPAMLVELVTAAALVRYASTESTTLAWVGLGLVVLIWLATATLSVPAHNSLTAEYSTNAYQKLVSTNWIRTAAWSARGILVLVLTYQMMK